MSSSIDPIRRAARLRRAARAAERSDALDGAERAGLPVPLDGPAPIPPRAETPPAGAAFDAHLLGQDGQKRGLRAGPAHVDSASASYNRIEWSGSKDRRARKGRIAKTEI